MELRVFFNLSKSSRSFPLGIMDMQILIPANGGFNDGELGTDQFC